MEYVHGRNLEDYARDEPVTPRRAAELVAKLAGALAMVHRRGIVHRDIKPRNILIDEAGEPRLIDFGLARLRNAWSDPFATSWGGTLAYMAPEQARLEHDRIGPRSDVFGLGAVLYFLLTGRPPFAGADQEETWDRARRCDFDAGALRAAGVPRRLERICRKALAADPADRYATAEEFGRALGEFLRRPARLAVGAAVLLAAAIVVPLGLWARPGAPAGDEPAGRPAIEVHRGGEILTDLKDALPLRTGDRLRIRCAIPSGYRASAFWYDSEGRLSELGPASDRPGPTIRSTGVSPARLGRGRRAARGRARDRIPADLRPAGRGGPGGGGPAALRWSRPPARSRPPDLPGARGRLLRGARRPRDRGPGAEPVGRRAGPPGADPPAASRALPVRRGAGDPRHADVREPAIAGPRIPGRHDRAAIISPPPE